MALTRRFSHAGRYEQKPDLDGLLVQIQRLLRHHRFDRDEVNSALLKRYLPKSTSDGHAHILAALRKTLEAAQLDATTISYLTKTAEAEIDMAHSRRD